MSAHPDHQPATPGTAEPRWPDARPRPVHGAVQAQQGDPTREERAAESLADVLRTSRGARGVHRSAWDTGVTPWAPLWSRKDPPGVDAQTAPVGAYPMALRVEAGPSEDDAPQTGPADPDEAEALRRENAQLRRALDSRAVIDQATGALMLRYGLEAPTALAVLKRWSQSSNIAVNRIADTLVNVVCRHAPHQDADHGLADWLREQVNAPLTRSDGEASREW